MQSEDKSQMLGQLQQAYDQTLLVCPPFEYVQRHERMLHIIAQIMLRDHDAPLPLPTGEDDD